MIYEEYEAIWSKIRSIEKKLFKLIDKRSKLFDKTQPKTTQYDKELVDGKKQTNIQEQYVIEEEYLNERIMQLNITLDDLYQVLKRKRDELRQSKNIYDRIYYYFRIERISVYKIANLTSYSQSQIYRKLEKIGIKTKDAKKCENKYANMILWV